MLMDLRLLKTLFKQLRIPGQQSRITLREQFHIQTGKHQRTQLNSRQLSHRQLSDIRQAKLKVALFQLHMTARIQRKRLSILKTAEHKHRNQIQKQRLRKPFTLLTKMEIN